MRSLSSQAQTQFFGKVIDAKDKTPIPFCAVAVLHTSRGTLANEEGNFVLWLRTGDTLIFQHPSYERKLVPLTLLSINNTVSLKQNPNNLPEVSIDSGNEWLFELFDKCRNNLIASGSYQSKAYFTLQSSIGNKPVELLECYYNATLNAAKLQKLDFKNGRAGAAQFGSRYFMNLNTSHVFSSIDLVEGHQRMPLGPFECTKQQLHKKFKLKVLGTSGGTQPIIHISFIPKKNNSKNFSGEVWIDNESGKIRRISMNCGPTDQHPFQPLFPNGRIAAVTMHINKVFSEEGLPEHLDFQYDIKYEHKNSITMVSQNPDTVFTTACKGFMYFYDYGKTFHKPQFEYEQQLDDYRKIALLSGNDAFWELNKSPVYSNAMVEALKYFNKNGELFNFSIAGKPASTLRRQYFENHFIRWSADARLSLRAGRVTSDTTYSQGALPLHDQRFNFRAQIFMDLNNSGDTLQHYTATIFDAYSSWFDLPEKYYTKAFMNIYFDIYEIHRRKLEARLQQKGMDANTAIGHYKVLMAKADSVSDVYLSEVGMGSYAEPMYLWNEYVLAELGINNFKKEEKKK
jgi:hypothetical protein